MADARITIVYRTAFNGVLTANQVSVMKNSRYADATAPEVMTDDIMKNGAWVMTDDGTREFIPVHSILTIFVQEIKDEISGGAPAPDAELLPE